MKKTLVIILGFILITACEHDIPVTPEEGEAPADLMYAIDTLSVVEGIEIETEVPTVTSSSAVDYSLVVSPVNDEVTIDSDGIISVGASSAVGIYGATVIANNENGSTSFNDILIVNVIEEEKSGITELVYLLDTLVTSEGGLVNSSTPSFVNDPAVSFSLEVSPENDQITIDADGVITISNLSESGVFNISVVTNNENGESRFSNIMIGKVTSQSVTFTLDVEPLISQKCATCHTSGSQAFTNYDVAKSLITSMIDRVERESTAGGFMPSGRTALTEEEINVLKNWQSDGLKE